MSSARIINTHRAGISHAPAITGPHNFSPSKRPRVSVHAEARDDNNNKPDLIESLVGRIFGQKALEDRAPGGMRRLDVPEMYAAVSDVFADPVDGDSPDIAILRPLLARTQLEKAPLRLAYSAERNGWTAEAFHECVNTFGAALVVARSQGKTPLSFTFFHVLSPSLSLNDWYCVHYLNFILNGAGGAVFGGYNPRGWLGLGEDRDSIAAFLFTWPDGKTTTALPIKLPKVGGPSLAVVDNPQQGIAFGAEGLKVLMPRKEKEAKSRLGTFYAKLPGGGRSLFGAAENPKSTELVSLECYVAQGDGEVWELDGIVWKTRVD